MGGRGARSYTTRSLENEITRRINALNKELSGIRKSARASARSSYQSEREREARYGYNHTAREKRREYREDLYYEMGQRGSGAITGEIRRLKRERDAIRRGQRSLFG